MSPGRIVSVSPFYEFLSSFLLTILSIALMFSAIGVWLLLKWRMRVKSGSFISIPDEIFERLDESDNRVQSFEKLLKDYVFSSEAKQNDFFEYTAYVVKESKHDLEGINSHIEIFRKIAEENAEELQRYKNGYDITITKRLVLGVIRTLDDIDEHLVRLENNSNSSPEANLNSAIESLKAIKQLLIFKLSDEQIEPFLPDESMSLDNPEQSKRCDVIKAVPSANKELVGQISEVINPGYSMIAAEEDEIILRKANVVVFRGPPKSEEDNA